MKILWLDINSSYSHSSLALPALHAQIMNTPLDNMTEWKVVRGTIKSEMSELLEQIDSYNPDIIFSTLWLFTHDFVMALHNRIKALCPNSVTVMGGPEFLGDNQEFLLRNRGVDAVFRGEGEEFLPSWLPIWNEKEHWREVRGLCFIENDIYVDGGRAVVANFSSLRFPEESPFFVTDKSFVQLETTRGCFNSCQFCVSGADKPVRSLSIEQIRSRLQFFASKGIKSIRMLDRTFNGNSRRCVEMLDLMNEFHGRLTFHLEVHPSLLRDELRIKLASMPTGLLHLEAGIQSLHQEVLDECTRNGNVDTALSGLTFLFTLSEKMETHTDLIAGLPLYTYDCIVSDVKTLVEMNAGEVQLETLKVLPGTEMRRRASMLGLRYSNMPPYEILSTPHISYALLRRAMLLSRLLDVYFNHSVLRKLFREIVLWSETSLEECIDFFSKKGEQLFSISLETQARMLYSFIEHSLPELKHKMQEMWIEHGLNLNNLPEVVSVLPMQSFLDAEYADMSQKERGRMRCYKVCTKQGEWIIVYDRGISQNKPVRIIKPNM